MSLLSEIRSRGIGLAPFAVAGAVVGLLAIVLKTKVLGLLAIPFAIFLVRSPSLSLMVTVASTITGYTFYMGGTSALVTVSIPKMLGVVTLGSLVLNNLFFRRSFEHGRRVMLPVAFIAVCGLSLVISPPSEIGTKTIVQLVGSFMFYYLVVSIVKDEETFERLVTVLSVSYAILSVWCIVQYVLPSAWTDEFAIQEEGVYGAFVDRGIKRSAGFSHPGIISFILTMLTPYIVWLLANAKTFAWKAVHLACLVFVVNAVFLSHTRAGFLSLVVIGIMFWRKGIIKINAPLLMGGILAAALFLFVFMPGSFGSRVLDFGSYSEEGSVKIRVENQANALAAFVENPLLGIGVGQFEDANDVGRKVNREVTNMLLEIAAELGIVGLALMLAFLGTMLHDAFELQRLDPEVGARNLGTMVLASLAVSLFSSLFMHNQDFREWWLFVALPAAAIGIRRRAAQDQDATAGAQAPPGSAPGPYGSMRPAASRS